MLNRLINAMLAATMAFRSGWQTGLARRAFIAQRPVWDDGINYDIPTFLRRSLG